MPAFYQTYRPKTFADIIGQELTISILQNMAKRGRLSHAYLFHGVRGTGKTTVARIVAKVANCEKRKEDDAFRASGEPCNKCGACVAIEGSRALDVIEIDAASNRGIDEIRNLKEGVKTSPSILTHKVYIIDEVHMLTREAFNALLKTLEEPPAHAIFILATTEYEKLPATILSRVQKFPFRKLPKKEIITKLAYILKKEKSPVDAGALELIAASSDGSIRDAESLLDQVVGMEENVTLESVEQIIGKIGFFKINALAEHIVARDVNSALAFISDIEGAGQNIPQLNKDMIHYLRRILSLRVAPKTEELFRNELMETELAAMKELAGKIDVDRHVILIKNLIAAYGQMRYSPFPHIPFEVAIIESLK